jgi:ribosomal protein S6E (S10)
VLEPLEHFNKICDSSSASISKVVNAKNKLVGRLANLELREFIQVMGDGKLVNELVDVSSLVKGGCSYEGVYLSKEAARKFESIKKNIHAENQSGKTITLAKAKELFTKARKMADISWNFKDDGCVARAHIMARRFEAEGVHVDKVWIQGDLTVPELHVQWDKHVAPIVYVEDNNKIEKMVIDPSLFDRPVTVKEWEKKMTSKIPGKTSITAFPMPENSATMERASLAFSSSDAFHAEDTGNVSEATKMQQAKETMKKYLGN